MHEPADTNEGDESVRDLVLCGRRTISLVRADLRAGRSGSAGWWSAKVAGKRVTILANYGGRQGLGLHQERATVKPSSNGQFSASAGAPAEAAVHQGALPGARGHQPLEPSLKLPQSLASDSIKEVGRERVVTGKVDRGFLVGKRNPVVIQRIVCGRYRTVGGRSPSRSGRVRRAVQGTRAGHRGAVPGAGGRCWYGRGSKRYVRQFARALGITLTGQSG